MQGSVFSHEAFHFQVFLPLKDRLCQQLLLLLLTHVLALNSFFLNLLQLDLQLRFKPREALHVPLGTFQMPSHCEEFLILLRVHEFYLAHLVKDLLILGSHLVFNQKLLLEILVDFLQLVLQHLVLLHETANFLLALSCLGLHLLFQLLLLEVELSCAIEFLLKR